MPDYIYPASPPRVVVYGVDYEWAGPEGDQWAAGDHEGAYRRVVFCVPDEWDIEDGKGAVDLAVDVLNDQPAYLEPDCVPGTPSWFAGAAEPDFRTGDWVEYSVHLYGFSPGERDSIGKAYVQPFSASHEAE